MVWVLPVHPHLPGASADSSIQSFRTPDSQSRMSCAVPSVRGAQTPEQRLHYLFGLRRFFVRLSEVSRIQSASLPILVNLWSDVWPMSYFEEKARPLGPGAPSPAAPTARAGRSRSSPTPTGSGPECEYTAGFSKRAFIFWFSSWPRSYLSGGKFQRQGDPQENQTLEVLGRGMLSREIGCTPNWRSQEWTTWGFDPTERTHVHLRVLPLLSNVARRKSGALPAPTAPIVSSFHAVNTSSACVQCLLF